MLEKHQIVPRLLSEFPGFRARRDECETNLGRDLEIYRDILLFVRFLTDDLYEKQNNKQVLAAFEKMEEFLREGNSEVRALVTFGFFETLRIVAGWKPYGSDAFLHFLYPESRRVWTKLDAAWNLDLDDCGVLEREIVIWRLARQSLGYLNAA